MNSRIIDDPSLRSKRYVFRDRLHAGELLTKKLEECRATDALILAIPSGGVPVGWVVSSMLRRPMDVIIVRKVPIPFEPEAGFGAVGFDGTRVLNEALVGQLGLSEGEINDSVSLVVKEIERRMREFRGDEPFPSLEGRTVILVDDGLASGYTMLASVKSVRAKKASRVIVAVPTASMNAITVVSPHVDLLVCLNMREELPYAVADAYQRWYDLDDEEVKKYLRRGEKH